MREMRDIYQLCILIPPDAMATLGGCDTSIEAACPYSDWVWQSDHRQPQTLSPRSTDGMVFNTATPSLNLEYKEEAGGEYDSLYAMESYHGKDTSPPQPFRSSDWEDGHGLESFTVNKKYCSVSWPGIRQLNWQSRGWVVGWNGAIN